MKRIRLMFTCSALLAVLAGCGGGNDGGMAGGGNGAPGPVGPSVQNLDTGNVLAIARQTSETGSPFEINDGAVVVTGSSESTTPAEANLP